MLPRAPTTFLTGIGGLSAVGQRARAAQRVLVFFLKPLHLLSTKTPLQFVCTTASSTRQSCFTSHQTQASSDSSDSANSAVA